MKTLRIVEALDVIEHVGSCVILVRYVLRAVRSVLSDEKKLSIAALSQTLPERLIEQTTPLSAMSRWERCWRRCSTYGRRVVQ